MKVITIEKLAEYIETKHGKQTITKDNNSLKLVIHNENTDYTNKSNVHCEIDFNFVNDLNSEYPFIKSREAEAGALVIDGKIPRLEELNGFVYKL